MKKIVFIPMFIVLAISLTACGMESQYPYIKIVRTALRSDQIIIPVDYGYKLSRQIYTIVDTDEGYDIVIHTVKE